MKTPPRYLTPRSYARTPAPLSSISSNGNDVSGIANVQQNVGHHTEETRKNHYGHNITVLNVTTNEAVDISNAKSQRIHNKLDAFEEIVDSMKGQGFRAPARQLTTPRQGNNSQHEPSFASHSQLQNTSAPDVVPNRNDVPKHYNGVIKYAQYPSFTQVTPAELAHYRKRLHQLSLISAFLFAIRENGYMVPYEGDLNIMEDWRSILRQKVGLQKVEALFQDPTMREAMKDHIPEDPTCILEATATSVQTVHNLLILSANNSPPKTKSNAGAARTSPRQRKNTASGSLCVRSPKKSPTSRGTPSIGTKALAINLRELKNNIKRLSAVCERIRRRADLLLNLRCSRNAYTMLYYALHDHCRQHEAHILDFNLESNSENTKGQTELKFRFAAVGDDGNISESEAWLTFRATEGLSQSNGPFPMDRTECLLDIRHSLTGSLGQERMLPVMHIYEGAQLACVHVGKQMRAAFNLTQMNSFLQEQCLVTEEEILRLAKGIATAVLKLNYTPWFNAFWNSDDVILFFDDSSHGLSLQDPHFRVRLENVAEDISGFDDTHFDSMLFCLGLVLYELWKYFPGDDEVYEPNLKDPNPEQLQIIREDISDQLEEWVGTGRMSYTYKEIILWCLNAPSSTVEEMKDPKRLNEMYEKVICGLEEVEKEYPTDIYEAMELQHP